MNNFIEAARMNNLNSLEDTINVQSVESLNDALVEAARNGNGFMIRLLLNHGADINNNDTGVTPLIAAVYLGNTKSIQYLLSKGADKSIKNNNGETPLEYCINAIKTYSNIDMTRESRDIAISLFILYSFLKIKELLEASEVNEPITLHTNEVDPEELFENCSSNNNASNNNSSNNNSSNNMTTNNNNNYNNLNNITGPIIELQVNPVPLETMPQPPNLPTKCFDPSMYNESANVTDAGATFYTFNIDGSVAHVACLDDSALEFYKSDKNTISLQCKSHMDLGSLHVGPNDVKLDNPLRRLPFKANVYVRNNQFASVQSGKKYALIPTNEEVGQIAGFMFVSLEDRSAVSADHCQDHYKSLVHTIKEIVTTGGRKKRTTRRRRNLKRRLHRSRRNKRI